MFEQAMIDTTVTGARARSTLLGLATQCTLLTAAVLVPLVFPDTLPRLQTVVEVFTLRPPGPPPGPPPLRTLAANRTPRPLQIRDGILTAPVSMPPKPVMIDEPPLTGAESGYGQGVPNGVIGGDANGIPGGIAGAIAAQVSTARPMALVPPAPPAKAPADRLVDPVRVSRGVLEAMLLHKVIPLYPPLARAARIAGVVQLVGRIGTDGRIRELQLVSGHPLLARAALDAVSQWVYRPTLLSGEPVEVIAPITVTFTLQ
jgi:protein TonB